MATIRQIPIRAGVVGQRFKTDLDGVPFEFSFFFNARSQRWTMEILDDSGNVLITGVPIHVKQLLLKGHQWKTSLPQGNLFAMNLVSENVPPTAENFGTDVVLLYEDIA